MRAVPVERVDAGAKIVQKFTHGLMYGRVTGDFVKESFELADAERGDARVH
jgi:hypothetical protein